MEREVYPLAPAKTVIGAVRFAPRESPTSQFNPFAPALIAHALSDLTVCEAYAEVLDAQGDLPIIYRYVSEDGRRSLLCTVSGFEFHLDCTREPFGGWREEAAPFAREVFEAADSAFGGRVYRSVEVRMRNELGIPDAGEDQRPWLQIASGLPIPDAGIVEWYQRYGLARTEGGYTVLNYSMPARSQANDPVVLTFDVEHYLPADPPVSLAEALILLDRAAESQRTAFEAILTDRTRDHFRGGGR